MLHPSGALVYVPFLTGPAPASAPYTGLRGGVDILEAHTGRLRLRVILPEPLAMLSTDVDGLHGRFLAIDENGQRIFCADCAWSDRRAARPRAVGDRHHHSSEWVCVWRSHFDDSRQRISGPCDRSHRRQICSGNISGYEYAKSRYTRSECRQISGRGYQPRRRNRFGRCKLYRQLIALTIRRVPRRGAARASACPSVSTCIFCLPPVFARTIFPTNFSLAKLIQNEVKRSSITL